MNLYLQYLEISMKLNVKNVVLLIFLTHLIIILIDCVVINLYIYKFESYSLSWGKGESA